MKNISVILFFILFLSLPKVVSGQEQEYMKTELNSIREQVKQINSIPWTNVTKIDLSETTEGGEITLYEYNGNINKITIQEFGKMAQSTDEFYLIDSIMIYAFEQLIEYNVPMYYDSTRAAKDEVTEWFNLEKSKFTEERSYFLNGKLIRQVNNQDCGSPFSEDYLMNEQIRIYKYAFELLNLKNK